MSNIQETIAAVEGYLMDRWSRWANPVVVNLTDEPDYEPGCAYLDSALQESVGLIAKAARANANAATYEELCDVIGHRAFVVGYLTARAMADSETLEKMLEPKRKKTPGRE